MSTRDPYPVRLSGRLDPKLSRGLWLVKWLLVVPHAVVLLFLWTAAFVLTVVTWFAILVTGRYPRAIFDFNVGVLRWTWRVAYFAYGALGTDRYPPFTLADVPDYPAHLDAAYPERLSRGLVLVKSWLLAIPHLLVLGFFFGIGSGVVADASGHTPWPWSVGLVGLLVAFAGVALLFTGSYPRPVFDLVMGMDRWGARVAAYLLLMTDDYPPFRLDQGEQDPYGGLDAPPTPVAAVAPARPGGWTALRIIGAVAGSVVVVPGLLLGLGGGAVLLADHQLRDQDGFLMSQGQRFDTASYAIVTEDVRLHDSSAVDAMVGKIRLTVSGSDAPVFLGIAPTSRVADYLAGVRHSELADIRDGVPVYHEVAGSTPPDDPAAAGLWQVSISGSGTHTLTWKPENGDWTIVLMNADASPGVSADVAAGATLPVLGWSAAALLGAAGVLLVGGIILLLVSLPRPPEPPVARPAADAPPSLSGAAR
ncbi:DUF4389 domain-containing protein [Nocardioides panacisoli]|uniref:DUF4389 domain-containing protein n=1 Tax=Nocardioides panacisoli TaxID=627624 RepID=A0ABP7IS81_9ACTN